MPKQSVYIETTVVSYLTAQPSRDLKKSLFLIKYPAASGRGIEKHNKDRGDAFHLALATFHGMDFLVSWNFSHILSARVRAVIQEINTIRGISTPIICVPEELMEG